MMRVRRGSGLAVVALAFCLAGPATAQESLDSGKTGAQLFASNCAMCHKSPQGLAKPGSLFGLSGFLREHYTASRESAAAIAAYVESAGRPVAPAKRTGPAKRTAKGDDKGKPGDKKPAAVKPGEAKSNDGKPAQAKTSEPKPVETKPTDAKTNDVKPAEPKPAEAKASEPKPDAAPAAKPDKPEKSD